MEKKKEELKTEAYETGAETKRGRSRRNVSDAKETEGKRFPAAGLAAAVIILTAGAGCGVYFAQAGTYTDAFLPNTTINGIDVSKKTIDEVKAVIEEGLSGYELTVLERTGAGEVIKTEEIGLHSEFNGSLEKILNAQEPMKWIKSLWTPAEYEIETMIVYDEAKFAERVRSLSCMDVTQMMEPQDAKLSDYRNETKSYEIIRQTDGTELVEEYVLDAVSKAVLNLQAEVDLEAESCYTKPSVLADDVKLTAAAAELNKYVGAVVNHTFGDTKEVLDGDEIHTWLTVDGFSVILDESRASQYVRALAKKYNTAYGKKELKTSYGKTVTISGGNYGWRMNETKEAAAVLEIVKEGSQQTREPEWIQTAARHGTYDFGDTYVEINLTAQHLFFYKDGKLLVETDFVSGNESRGWSTPAGAYPLTYKQRNATLRGENYATPVSYWMPFNGNIGLHDADWRSSFGGTLYKTGGSHGCVNLPPQAAKIIYENLSKGDPVLCYHLAGTESGKISKPGDIKIGGETQETTAAPVTQAVPQTTAAAQTTPAETSVPETTAPETTTVPETTAPAVTETAPGPSVPETEPAGPSVQPETSPSTPGPTMETTAPSVPDGPGSTPGGPGSQSGGTGNGTDGPGNPGNVSAGPGAQTAGGGNDYSAGPGAQ